MGTKTIRISHDAYQRLRAAKKEGESFSELVRRLTGGHLLRALAGRMDENTARHYRETIRQGRRREDAATGRRMRKT